MKLSRKGRNRSFGLGFTFLNGGGDGNGDDGIYEGQF
jgi:hypothetical protein